MPDKRCVSGCKGLDADICDKAPRCSYANGERRQFCRLARTHKMNKRDCTVRRKTSKNQKADTIHKFMKQTKTKRRLEFLKSVCDDSGLCIALGTNREKIIDFFDGFVNFENVNPPIKAIGKPSSNGFVKSITYEKNGYKSEAVLKSSVKTSSDNLAYEYLVGLFLNEKCKQYPCFVETYGLFYYKTPEQWQHAMETQTITTNVLKDSLEKQDNELDFKRMCNSAKYGAILIQHLSGVKTIGDMIMKASRSVSANFYITEMLPILYQVYFPLSQMSKEFTHYDLHQDNVLLYEPAPGKIIQYHYHQSDGSVVEFKSPYIAKAIDYGRSYFESDKMNSFDILKKLCKEPECDDKYNKKSKCGNSYGFQYMNTGGQLKDAYYICSAIHNPSHDLRLMSILGRRMKELNMKFKNNQTHTEILEMLEYMFENTIYGEGLTAEQRKKYYVYGTKAKPKSGITIKSTKINNVNDAEAVVRDCLDFSAHWNEVAHSRMDKFGDIHVYSDGRPMKFVSAA